MLGLSDILQVDATVIAGILILLTIGSFKVPEHSQKNFLKFFTKEQLTAFVVMPFAGSAIQILSKYTMSPPYVPTETSLTLADVGLPIVGFIYLIFAITWIAKRSKYETNR